MTWAQAYSRLATNTLFHDAMILKTKLNTVDLITEHISSTSCFSDDSFAWLFLGCRSATNVSYAYVLLNDRYEAIIFF